jgi:zinc finger protein 830
MSDVRSMLRNERTARRIDHPNATYTATGKLICAICQTQIASESLWGKHLKSREHDDRLQERERVSASVPGVTFAASASTHSSHKRKASDTEEENRKRVRADETSNVTEAYAKLPVHNDLNATEPLSEATGTSQGRSIAKADKQNTESTTSKQDGIDEDEWAAFERDVATPPPDTAPISALTAPVSIEVAPISAGELAAQVREDKSKQWASREAEAEAEKEDAARFLEEEFDRMDGLEERVKRLREKREALRQRRESAPKEIQAEEVTSKDEAQTGVESGSSDDDEGDEWNFFG